MCGAPLQPHMSTVRSRFLGVGASTKCLALGLDHFMMLSQFYVLFHSQMVRDTFDSFCSIHCFNSSFTSDFLPKTAELLVVTKGNYKNTVEQCLFI